MMGIFTIPIRNLPCAFAEIKGVDCVLNQTGTMGFGSYDSYDNIPQKSCFHAILVDRDGGISELWLPATVEGKYTFPLADESISIIAENSMWKACITNGGYFAMSDQTGTLTTDPYARQTEIFLQSNSLNVAHIGNKVFSLYLEDDCDSGRVFQPYYIGRNMDIFIGREPVCDIQYINRFVSREHAVLHHDGTRLTITDKNSKNGVYVNGRRIQSAELVLGDVVHILGLCIIVGAGYIQMNNATKCKIMSHRVIPLESGNQLAYLNATGTVHDFYDRKPRKKYKLDEKVIEISSPPPPLPKTKIPLALRLGNNAIMGGQAIMTGNYIGAVSSLLLPAMTQGLTEKDRLEYEAKRTERYREYLQCKAVEIAQQIQFEENFFNEIFPNFYQTLGFVENRSRLWERRKMDDDFLTVRLGTGTIPMVAEKKYNPRHFELEPDFLEQEMYALAEMPSMLNNVPITVSLQDDWILGLVGPQANTLQMVIQLIGYIAVTHAYDDVKMVLLVPEALKKEFNFTKYLPHFWSNDRAVRFVASNSADVQVITKHFRDIETKNKDKSVIVNAPSKEPACIVFALDKNLFEQSEIFKELLQEPKYKGFSFVPAFENVPKECMKLVDLRSQNLLIDLNDPFSTDIALSIDYVDPAYFQRCMTNLSRISLLMESESSFSLPSMVTFLEMYGVGKVEHLNPLSRWESNNPVKSLAVPIGVGTDGNLFTLDLHEKHQGPHGLVAGMTGSGKSEFIITYILSLAVNFSPDEAAFVLIDYKGGGLADAFVDPKRGIHLPHVVATITNLDGAAIQRSLTSIESELKRRQSMFKKAKSATGEGTMDIYDYQRLYRSKKVSEPMPHLFIISDEFAELKSQQPEFMDALISAARIGRSLGVHLILATQKPGGVVNDQIWSNTKFRACLKVQDRSDSNEMLKRPEAAELKQTGRFYLQVGYNEFFALGQSAWCGAGYIPQEEIIKEKDSAIEFIDNTGRVTLKAKPKKPTGKADRKQIVAIVQYLSDLAKRENIIPKSLWCDPLPAKLEYNDLAAQAADAPQEGVTALMGLIDVPAKQEQHPLFLNLNNFHHLALCGSAGSGKSTFFKTMLYSLVTRYTPEDLNYYILDLSGGVLSVFRHMPHCGAYLTKENESDFDRMLTLIHDIVEERKKLFAEAEVFSYDDYIKFRKLPAIMVIIDGWTNILEFAKGQQYSIFINKDIRDASNYGVHFMFSVNNRNEIASKVQQEFDYWIALQAKDKFDYNDMLGTRNATVPPVLPGRGLCVVDGGALEYQVATPNCTLDVQQQQALLKEELEARAAQLQGYQSAKCLPVMDDELEYVNFCNSFAPSRIPLGFSMDTMQEIAIPLQQLFNMGVYFGNPLGIKPVIFNLLTAFRREQADVIIVRRSSGTIFDRDTDAEVRGLLGERCTILDMTEQTPKKLFTTLIEEFIPQYRVPYRDEYCERHGIPATDKGRTVKAAKYIRSKTAPLFILFESFADLAAADKEELFSELFAKLKGFNIYFTACFYPDDENMSYSNTLRNFNKDEFSLCFGGQFHKVWSSNLDSEFRRMEKINPNYNRFVMRYRNECHRMVMPCGTLIAADADPDEKEII